MKSAESSLQFPDLLDVQNFTPTKLKDNTIHAKICVNFVKVLIATKLRILSNLH